MDFIELARERLTVDDYHHGLYSRGLYERFKEEAEAAARESATTGRPFVDCFPDPYMVLGMRREEMHPAAFEMMHDLDISDPESFPIDTLMRSDVPAGHERVREWLSLRRIPLTDAPQYWQCDWSTILSVSLTERLGLPIESLVELGELLREEDDAPSFSHQGGLLLSLYASHVLMHSDCRIGESELVASLMPQGTLASDTIDRERYPTLHKAVHTGRHRRTRERIVLTGFDIYADEFEALLQGLTPSGCWDAFEYLAHVLDDPWKLLGKRREEMTPGTLLFLENSSGSTLVRYNVAIENAENPHTAAWAAWLSFIDDGRETLWHAMRRVDRDLVTSTLRSLYWSPPSDDSANVRVTKWATSEGSCIDALTEDDINEMIRRGISAPEAADLLRLLGSAEAFRLHFYEGMPAEYAAAVVGWPDVR